MITKIWLQEYGPFRDASFTLEPLTVLVGPNASGKTMAMEALHHVRQASDTFDPVGYLDAESFYEAKGSHYKEQLLNLQRKSSSEDGSLVVRVKFEVDHKCLFYVDYSAYDRYEQVDPSDNEPTGDRLPVNEDNMPLAVVLKLEPGNLRRPSYLDAEVLNVNSDGYGLATVLADMKLQDDEDFKSIIEQSAGIVPNLEGVRLRRADVPRNGEHVAGNEIIVDVKDAHGLPPKFVSDGTILVLGVVTSIVTAVRNRKNDETVLVLIDELERGLHPRALSDFIGCLRKMTETMPVQILATSHSPYLLDYLKPEEVRLTGFLDDGTATICELSQHPEFERWKNQMTPGEFWSTFGEDWIADVVK